MRTKIITLVLFNLFVTNETDAARWGRVPFCVEASILLNNYLPPAFMPSPTTFTIASGTKTQPRNDNGPSSLFLSQQLPICRYPFFSLWSSNSRIVESQSKKGPIIKQRRRRCDVRLQSAPERHPLSTRATVIGSNSFDVHYRRAFRLTAAPKKTTRTLRH